MRYLLLVLFAFLISCGPPPPPSNVLIHKGHDVYWEYVAFPLVVAVPDNLPAKKEQVIKDAIANWNKAVGEPVFVMEKLRPEHPILLEVHFEYKVISMTYAYLPKRVKKNVLGTCWRRMKVPATGAMYSSICQIEKRLDPEKQYNKMVIVTTHELGHVLGLAHDPSKESVMYGGSIRDSEGQLEQRDIDRVRRMVHGTVTLYASETGDDGIEAYDHICTLR